MNTRTCLVSILCVIFSASIAHGQTCSPAVLEQSQAATLRLGPFFDDTDFVTEETALTISQADVRVSKNGAAAAQKNDSGACTHDENGWYRCGIDATDANTTGSAQFSVHETGALPVWCEATVMATASFEAWLEGNLQDDTSVQSNVVTALGTYEAPKAIETGTIGATGNDTTHLHLTGIAWADDEPNNKVGVRFVDVSAGDVYWTVIRDFANTGDLATVDTLPVTPEDSTDTYQLIHVAELGLSGAQLTAVPWNAAWDAEVQSEVDDALQAGGLDHLVSIAGTADSGTTGTLVDAALTQADADWFKGHYVIFTDGTLQRQDSCVTAFDPATDTLTFLPPVSTAVTTHGYVLVPGSCEPSQQILKNTEYTNFYVKMTDSSGNAVTGLSDIVCQTSEDGGALVAIADTTEVEIGEGWYVLTIAAAEINADNMLARCTSATAGGDPFEAVIDTQR